MDEDQSYAFDTLELSDPLGLLQVRKVKTVILKESLTTNHTDSHLSDNLDDKQYLYKCTLCNEDFANKYFAKIHKDSQHSNIPDTELFSKHSVEKIQLQNVEQLTRQETLKSELEKMQIRMLNVIRKEELVENRRQKLKDELLSKFLNQSYDRHDIKSSDENSLKVKIGLNDSVNNAENAKEFASKCKVKPFKMTRKQFVKKSKVKYSRKIYKCLLCSIHFMTELTLQEHLTKTEHLTENFEKSVRNCDICELDFDLQSYPLHILTHHIQMGLKRDFLIVTEVKSTEPSEEVVTIKTELPEETIRLNVTIADQIRSFKQEPDESIEHNVISHLEDIITKYIEESQKSSSNKTVELAESIPLTLQSEFINETTAKAFKKRDLSETLKLRLDLKQFDNRLYNCKNCSIHFLHYNSVKKHHKSSCNKNSTVKVKCMTCGLYFSDRSLRKHEYVHHDKMKLHLEDFSIVTVPEFNTSLSIKEQGNKRFEYFIDDNVSKDDKQSSDKENFDIKRNRVEKLAEINKISEEFTSEKIDFRYDIFNGEITKCRIEIYTDSEDDFVKYPKEDSLNISLDNISNTKAKDLNNDFNKKINEKTKYPDKEYTSKEFMAKLNLIPLDKNLYKCGKCSLHFLAPEKLHIHLKKTCRNADVTKCLICRLDFDTNSVLHHKYLHHTKMKLKYKDFIVRTKSGLINDLKQTDKNKRREKKQVNLYKCKECSLHFLSKENLEDYHQTRCKSNVRSLVKCLTCKLPFSAKCLRRHIYLHHKETQMLREDFNIITISNDVNRKRFKNSQYSKDFSEVIALNEGIKYLQIGDSIIKKTP